MSWLQSSRTGRSVAHKGSFHNPLNLTSVKSNFAFTWGAYLKSGYWLVFMETEVSCVMGHWGKLHVVIAVSGMFLRFRGVFVEFNAFTYRSRWSFIEYLCFFLPWLTFKSGFLSAEEGMWKNFPSSRSLRWVEIKHPSNEINAVLRCWGY